MKCYPVLYKDEWKENRRPDQRERESLRVTCVIVVQDHVSHSLFYCSHRLNKGALKSARYIHGNFTRSNVWMTSSSPCLSAICLHLLCISSADYRSTWARNAWLQSCSVSGWWMVSSLVNEDKAQSMCRSVAAWRSCRLRTKSVCVSIVRFNLEAALIPLWREFKCVFRRSRSCWSRVVWGKLALQLTALDSIVLMFYFDIFHFISNMEISSLLSFHNSSLTPQ